MKFLFLNKSFLFYLFVKIIHEINKSIIDYFYVFRKVKMNSIRVRIYLKYFFDENSSTKFYNFWYAFQPSKFLTINDIIEDIRLNYFQNHIPLNNQEEFIIHLDDCQVLPFTSSQILRDNDRLMYDIIYSFSFKFIV